jgi:hypothetical protein
MKGAARRSLACCAGATSIAVAAVLGLAAPAHSTPPVHVAFPVDISYEIPELTAGCGVEVWFSLVGTFKGTLVRDRSGTVIGEFDSQPNTRITFSSPTTGIAFDYMFSTTFHSSYPEGLDPGDLVISSATGFLDKVPGLPASAGRADFPDGEVVYVEDGVPYVNYGEPALFHGRQNDPDAQDAAICARLRGD